MPSDSDNDSDYLLTQMTQKYGGDGEEAQGEEATQDTQASQASQTSQPNPKRNRQRLVLPTATVTSAGTPAENTDEAEEEGPPPPKKKKRV